jgi:FdhD protein
MTAPSHTAGRIAWREGVASQSARDIPEETPVAFTYNASTYAVMMATPADLDDFAVGFSLTEAIVDTPGDIVDLAIVETELGVEARMWLDEARAARLAERRRHLAGPTGCGLCGVESLEEVARRLRPVNDAPMSLEPDELIEAMASLGSAQALNRATHAVHAAGFWRPGAGLIAVREDVGRHNALDKLVGAMARRGESGDAGAVLLTSRVSVEMIQKTAVLGAPVVIAVSAPTALAVRTAQAAGITLVAVARGDGFEVFTHAERISLT